jgi:hypothetical protein
MFLDGIGIVLCVVRNSICKLKNRVDLGTPTEPCHDTCEGGGVGGVPLVLVSRVQILKGNNGAN